MARKQYPPSRIANGNCAGCNGYPRTLTLVAPDRYRCEDCATHGDKIETDRAISEVIAKELNYNDAEASRAFEWLREQALDGSRYAAIMLCEVAKLKERK